MINKLIYLDNSNIVYNIHICYYLFKDGGFMKGRIIVVEGTDCSGKETQTSLLVQRLRNYLNHSLIK